MRSTSSGRDEGDHRSIESLGRRILAGASAQALTRTATATVTVVSVPLMISAWGVGGFGEWIALTAIASYFGYSNFGLVTTAGNEIIMAVGAGDEARAARSFQMAVNVALYIIGPLLALVAGVAALLPIDELLNFREVTRSEASIVIALAAFQLWLGTMRGIVSSVLNAQGVYSLTYLTAAAAKMLELAAIVVVVGVLKLHQVSAALAVVSVALLDLTVLWFLARRSRFWPSLDLRRFDKAWLLSHLKPGVGFLMSDFATTGLLVQGPRLVLSAVLGGPAVAVYAIYGTAMRLTDQIVQTVATPLHVEIAYSTGQNDLRRTYGLILFGTQIAFVALVGVSIGLMVLGPFAFPVWTSGAVQFDHRLMALFLCMSAANHLGRISSEGLISTNRMYGTAPIMFALAVASLALGALLAVPFGLVGVILGSIAGELAISVVVIRAMRRWLAVDRGVLTRDLMNYGPMFRRVVTTIRGRWRAA